MQLTLLHSLYQMVRFYVNWFIIGRTGELSFVRGLWDGAEVRFAECSQRGLLTLSEYENN